MAESFDQPLIETFQNYLKQLETEYNSLNVQCKNLDSKYNDLFDETNKVYAEIVQCYDHLPKGKRFAEALICNNEKIIQQLNKEIFYPPRSFELLSQTTLEAFEQLYVEGDGFSTKSYDEVDAENERLKAIILETENNIKEELKDLKAKKAEFDLKTKEIEELCSNLNVCINEMKQEEAKIKSLLTNQNDDISSNQTFDNYFIEIEQQCAELLRSY